MIIWDGSLLSSKHNPMGGSEAGHVCHVLYTVLHTVAHPRPQHSTGFNRNILSNAAVRFSIDRLSLIFSEKELSATKKGGKVLHHLNSFPRISSGTDCILRSEELSE